MTIYCPNCGKPNTDDANKCVACGTELAARKAPAKFKGTMMMTGVGGPGLAPPPGPAPAPAPAPAAEPPKRDMAFQATMLGPMEAPPGAANALGMGQPAQGAAFGATEPAPPPGGAFGAAMGAPPAGPAPGGFGAPPAGPAPGGFGAPPAGPAPGGFGAPPAGGGFGAPPAGGGFGAPPAGGGFGAPPAGGGFGAPPSDPNAGGFGQPAGGFPAAPPPSGGMSTGAKVAIGCLVAVALACVIFLVVTFVIGKKASDAMANPDTNTPCGKAAACCTAVYTDLGQAAQAQQACAPIAAMGSMAGSDPNVAAQCTAATAQFTQMISGVPGKTIPAACQ